MIRKFIKSGELKIVLIYDRATTVMLDKIINYISEISSQTTLSRLVNVYIFGKKSDMERLIEFKGLNLGVSVVAKGLLSYHEAWEGIPTIYLCREVWEKYGNSMLRALIHHELAHALLHGELTYYILPADIDYDNLTIVESYTLFSGVKDFEVSQFLKEIGLGNYQEALVKYCLQNIEFNETLIKVLLFLLPFADIFDYVNSEIRKIFRKLIKSTNALASLKDILVNTDTFNKFRRIVNWYLKWWPRHSP